MSSFADGRLWSDRPGGRACRTRGRHAGGALAVRGPAVRPGPAGAVRRPRDARSGRRPARRRSATRSWRSRSPWTGRTAPGRVRVLVQGPDFVAAPRPSPDGRAPRLARVGPPGHAVGRHAAAGRRTCRPDGSLGGRRTVAGGPGISVVQPAWSAGRRPPLRLRRDGLVEPVRVRTGRTGLDGPARNLAPMEAELGDPAWVFGRSSYGFAADGVDPGGRPGGRPRRARPDRAGRRGHAGRRRRSRRSRACRVGRHGPSSSPRARTTAPCCCAWTRVTGEPAGVLARSLSEPLDPDVLPHRRADHVPDHGRRDRARPLLPADQRPPSRRPAGERPPLVVLSHGGPTSRASSALSLDRAFFTSRGIAVVDVDYRGSTGYGRPYRDALKGQWGIADVDDCVAAARFLADRGSVDPAPHGHPRRQRRRLHDARGAHLPSGGLRGRASATTASPTSS